MGGQLHGQGAPRDLTQDGVVGAPGVRHLECRAIEPLALARRARHLDDRHEIKVRSDSAFPCAARSVAGRRSAKITSTDYRLYGQ